MGAIAPLGWAGVIGSVLILGAWLLTAMALCRMALRDGRPIEIEVKAFAFARIKVRTGDTDVRLGDGVGAGPTAPDRATEGYLRPTNLG